jgi:hypothetical protein
MLSKCANPECSEILRYLHEGKIFYLAPTPEVEILTMLNAKLHERFWLCSRCSRTMTLVWDGTGVRLENLPANAAAAPVSEKIQRIGILGKRDSARSASAGREDQ